MTQEFSQSRLRLSVLSRCLYARGCAALIAILMAGLPSACTRLLPPAPQRDLAAERMVARLKQTNAGLTRFKCIAKMTLVSPGKPVQSFRTAVAGEFPDYLRIDLFSPYGGSAGSLASDGKHLYLVMYAAHEYYKKRFGDGSLRRFVDMDITVGDLLALLVGRIPMDADYAARLMPAVSGSPEKVILLLDRWGHTRQRITLDSTGLPVRVVWFDSRQHSTKSVTITGRQVTQGFVLPKRIDLSSAGGQRISVAVDRYTVNVRFDEGLFTLPPLSS